MLKDLFQYALVNPWTAILNLNDNDTFIVNSDEGLGLPPFHRLAERSSGQDGETPLGFRLDPRIIHLRMTIRGDSPTAYYQNRKILLEFFRPSNLPYIFGVGVPDGVNPDKGRCLKVYLHKGLIFDTSKRNGLAQEADVFLVAPDPVFYDPTQVVNTCSPTYADPHIDLLLAFQGDWLTYPIIEIEGPILNPTVVNNGTLEKLSLAYQVIAGEIVTIDTSYGVKTVKNNSGVNLIGKLTTDSDLASFHLDHELPSGYTNTMHCTGTLLAGEHAHFTFKYYDRYVGI